MTTKNFRGDGNRLRLLHLIVAVSMARLARAKIALEAVSSLSQAVAAVGDQRRPTTPPELIITMMPGGTAQPMRLSDPRHLILY